MTSQWTTETMDAAAEGWYFIPVTDLVKDKITIDDAEEIWASNPDILFHTGARLVGLKDDIVRTFEEGGIKEEQINEMLEQMISSSNYQDEFAGEFQQEMQGWRNYVTEANVKSEGRTMSDIVVTAGGKTPVTSETAKAISTKTGAPAKKSPGTPSSRGRSVAGLQNRINQAINEGKYVVVSKMKENGAGTTLANAPQRTTKNYYNIENPDLPISSADMEHFLMAIDMLEGGREEYADDIQNAEDWFSGKSKPAKKTPAKTTKSTTTAESTTPSRVTGPITGPITSVRK